MRQRILWTIVVLAVLSIVITNLIQRFERWMTPWRVVAE